MRIAIIGAGAAGCFAAANIPRSDDREVVIFEKSNKALQKVKVSGGGRCNVTHECFDIPELIKKYPRGKNLLKKTLHQFSPQHTIDWFQERGITIKAEADGRMFPSTNTSQTIIDCLRYELSERSVQINYGKAIEKITKQEDALELSFKDGTTYLADKVLIACGGFPKKEQYKWIEDTGHTIQDPVPSLFTFNIPNNDITKLMGVSVQNVSVKVLGSKLKEQGPILITHWGLSGPVVLRCSAWGAIDLNNKNYDFKISINWLGEIKENVLREQFADIRVANGKGLVKNKNPFELPKRLWEYFISICDIDDSTRWAEMSSKSQNKLINTLCQQEFHVSGKTTFKEEFVTSGGITLNEISPKTLESRIIPNLYFAGEIMNVDGITGGFNFQHAWSSAYIASQNIIL